ncbi:ATP-binding domain-containing protein [Streptomyces sp. UH6]|uniref:HelD family protein n=1 Tax=Streptomyces sp. UH6 TaxID=2748379 RepID=UPI001C551166|nr:ATP-binding domain-containing protein [Streptomyces sp. UH6]
MTEALRTHDGNYRDVKTYMAENRGEIDPTEMYQNELLLRDIDAEGGHAMRVRERLEAMRDTPYFARLDFTPDATRAREIHYIGRHTLHDEEGTAVVDWRSPLGGVYYEAGVGRAGYEAPAARIHGLVEGKRQIKIEEGRLRFAVDTADAVHDEVLLEEIGRTTDARMRSIIATIQSEQNAIIRNETDTTLVVQGVAGSGKTSVALHRIAYLLYRRRGRLQAGNVAILSPNGLFAAYVSEVLPELGEEPVAALELTGIAHARLKRHRLSFTAPVDPVEPGDDEVRERAVAKSSLSFQQWLERAVDEELARCFQPRGLRLKGCELDADELRALYGRMHPLPVRRRLRAMAEFLCARDRDERPFATTRPRPGEVAKELTSMLTVKSASALHRELYHRADAPATLRTPTAGTLEWADVYPFLFVSGRFDGIVADERVEHLVIDEMQDYSPTQYAVLRQIFRCDMTVLGDVGQVLGNTENYTLDDLAGVFHGARVRELRRSYRSTAEIMRYAARIQGRRITTIDRHGDEPTVLGFATRDAETGWIAQAVQRFRDAGRGRLAIITRTRVRAQDLRRHLSEKLDGIGLAAAGSDSALTHDVTVVPVALAKGLEFDEVIVALASAEEYHRPADRSLLYIACTRALHRLTLTHTGRPSPHLPV